MRRIEEELSNLKKEYDTMKVPDKGVEIMIKAMERAKKDKRKEELKLKWKKTGLGAAAACAILFILPNTNAKIAHAMEQLPLVGKIFEVITIRDYTYADEHNSAEIKVPKVISSKDETKEHPAVNEVNKSVEEYINQLLAQFENNMQIEGYQNLNVSYQVITNNDSWFALDIAAVETQASGYEFHRYYNIDKVSGKQVELKDLFKEGSDYAFAISEEIKSQMIERMAKDEGVTYWLDNTEYPQDNFKQIKDNQSFYLDKDGNLVIVFDEYEVAPGYMGVQQFVINKEVLKDIVK